MEDIEETDLEVISFNDLDEDLKDRVRDYYRNDDFIPRGIQLGGQTHGMDRNGLPTTHPWH